MHFALDIRPYMHRAQVLCSLTCVIFVLHAWQFYARAHVHRPPKGFFLASCTGVCHAPCMGYLPLCASCTGVLFFEMWKFRALCMAIFMLLHTCGTPSCRPSCTILIIFHSIGRKEWAWIVPFPFHSIVRNLWPCDLDLSMRDPKNRICIWRRQQGGFTFMIVIGRKEGKKKRLIRTP